MPELHPAKKTKERAARVTAARPNPESAAKFKNRRYFAPLRSGWQLNPWSITVNYWKGCP